MDQQRDYPGSNIAACFAARGVRLTPGEASELVRVFLRLADLGAISTAPADECLGSEPIAPASAGVSGADRGAGVARDTREPGVLGGPTVYNMGPSDYIGAQM